MEKTHISKSGTSFCILIHQRKMVTMQREAETFNPAGGISTGVMHSSLYDIKYNNLVRGWNAGCA
jgi:hypothetical protein